MPFRITGFLLLLFTTVRSFAPPERFHKSTNRLMAADQNNGQKEGIFAGVTDFFNNLDAVADDFFYKRMGKGEIFYGKRKFKPSGDVEGDYDGMGLSDKLKIDMAREYKEEWLEEKRMRDEIRMLREEFEERNSQ